MMKLLVPCKDFRSYQMLSSSGADEFYLGFYDDAWSDSFGCFSDLNRMSGFGDASNPMSFEEAMEVCDAIAMEGKRAFVTLNSSVYSQAQLNYIEQKYLSRIAAHNVAGVIFSSITLARILVQYGISPVASTMCGIYNEDIARLYLDLGVSRMILPRDLSLAELCSLQSAIPNVELEVFLMRNGCMFSDPYCFGVHQPECGALCTFLRSRPYQTVGRNRDFNVMQTEGRNAQVYDQLFHLESRGYLTCGLCALYRLQSIGIRALKVVGRADNIEAVCSDVALAKRNLETLSSCESEAEYLSRMEMPRDARTRCLWGLSCYYPEVRFGE